MASIKLYLNGNFVGKRKTKKKQGRTHGLERGEKFIFAKLILEWMLAEVKKPLTQDPEILWHTRIEKDFAEEEKEEEEEEEGNRGKRE